MFSLCFGDVTSTMVIMGSSICTSTERDKLWVEPFGARCDWVQDRTPRIQFRALASTRLFHILFCTAVTTGSCKTKNTAGQVRFRSDSGACVFAPQKYLWDPILWAHVVQRPCLTWRVSACHYTWGGQGDAGGGRGSDRRGQKIWILGGVESYYPEKKEN